LAAYGRKIKPTGGAAQEPITMKGFLDEDLSVTGTFRKNTGQFPNMDDEYFIEVTQATILPSN